MVWIGLVGLVGWVDAHAVDQAPGVALPSAQVPGAAQPEPLVAQPPGRIVSLLPSLTEIVCALDACDRLVGTDRYSNHPPQVLRLPKVGGGVDPSVEAVLALKPDLVLAAHSTRANGRLRELGLRVLELEPRSLADLHNALLVLGHTLDAAAGRQRGQRLWDGLDGQILAVARALPPSARGARVYFEASGGDWGGYAAGPGSFTDDILRRMNLVNIVPMGQGPYPKINPEFVVRQAPDVIVLGQRQAAGVAQRPGWAGLPVVRGQRVCALSSADADMLVRAGPRVVQAAQLLRACVEGAVGAR